MPEPKDAPPSYETAIADDPAAGSNIPPEHRRSMEDEQRELPEGWVRQFDTQHNHQYFVDTRQEPPRSVWHHPYDDEDYLKTLSSEERKRIENLHQGPEHIKAGSAHEGDQAGPSTTTHGVASSSTSDEPHGFHKFGRKLKDKVTMSTHEEREAERQDRARKEQEAYEIHRHMRQAMVRAVQTGQPQFLFKDREGRDVYIEPPQGPRAPPGAHGYNPYTQGPYSQPNARFIRPGYDYARPPRMGYNQGMALGFLGGALPAGLIGATLF